MFGKKSVLEMAQKEKIIINLYSRMLKKNIQIIEKNLYLANHSNFVRTKKETKSSRLEFRK